MADVKIKGVWNFLIVIILVISIVTYCYFFYQIGFELAKIALIFFGGLTLLLVVFENLLAQSKDKNLFVSVYFMSMLIKFGGAIYIAVEFGKNPYTVSSRFYSIPFIVIYVIFLIYEVDILMKLSKENKK